MSDGATEMWADEERDPDAMLARLDSLERQARWVTAFNAALAGALGGDSGHGVGTVTRFAGQVADAAELEFKMRFPNG